MNNESDENITIDITMDLHEQANHEDVGKRHWVFHDLENQFENEKVEVDSDDSDDSDDLDMEDDPDMEIAKRCIMTDCIMNELVHYNVKQLQQIMEYYKLRTAYLKKQDLIEHILLFENDKVNDEIVNRRRLLWNYLHILKSDPYTKRFLFAF
jgi:hypothetical protein